MAEKAKVPLLPVPKKTDPQWCADWEEVIEVAIEFYEIDGEPHGPWESVSPEVEDEYMEKAHDELGF